MSLSAVCPGLVAGLVFLLLSPHEPWGVGFPSGRGLDMWLLWLRSWADPLGTLLSFGLASSFYMPRLRDKEVFYAVFLWLVTASGLHHAPPAGMATFGLLLIWAVLLAGGSAFRGGFKGAAGINFVLFGAPSLCVGAAPLGVHLVLERARQRRDFLVLVGGSAFGVLLFWHLDPTIRQSLTGAWRDLLALPAQPLRICLKPLRVLLSDPVFWMAFPGCLLLGRIGVSRPLRISLFCSMVMAWLGAALLGGAPLAAFAPLFGLAVGAFLDQQIAARSLWLGVMLGSVVAYLHIDHLKILRPLWVHPWWATMGGPSWLPSVLPVLLIGSAAFLILRATLRVGGLQARILRGFCSLGVAVLTALIIAASHRLS